MNLDDPQPKRCLAEKQGRFAKLRCVKPRGHRGSHNYVTVGVSDLPPKPVGYRRKRKAVP